MVLDPLITDLELGFVTENNQNMLWDCQFFIGERISPKEKNLKEQWETKQSMAYGHIGQGGGLGIKVFSLQVWQTLFTMKI